MESAQDLQVRLVIRESPRTLCLGVLSAWLLAVAMWEGQRTAPYAMRAFSWAGVLTLVMLRGIVIARAANRNDDAGHLQRQSRRLQRNGAIVAVLWGLTSTFMLPAGDFEHEVILVVAISLIIVGGAIGRAVHMPGIQLLVMLSTTVFAVGLVLQPGSFHRFIGLGYLLFGAVMAMFLRAQENMVRRERELNLEIQHLLKVAEQARQEAERASVAKTRFLAAASHDLRQPAATLGLLLDMAREAAMAAPARELVERAREAAGTLGALLDRLLDLSRLDAPSRPPERRPVPLQALFDAVAGHELAHARSRGLRLRFRPTAAWVSSDPVLLEQILRNLVGNALRYTQRGGVLVGLRRRGATGLRLEVWDSGHGIAPEHQSLIFEEFAQLPAPDGQRGNGLGLGLAIVDRAARQLGHARGLASRPGRGSCFWIELPRADPAPREAAAPAAAAPEPACWPGAPSIWLVEDETPLREALAELLARHGARVRAFAGQAALAAHLAEAQDWPDALVCDHHLGDGSGDECIAQVRAGAPLPVAALLITGGTAPPDIARQSELGVPVLHKPFDGARLIAALASLLRPTLPNATT